MYYTLSYEQSDIKQTDASLTNLYIIILRFR